MKFWQTVPFAAALAVLQAQSPSVTPIPSPSPTETMPEGAAPLYRVIIVQGSARAINYRNLKSSTEIDLKGTVLAPGAMGEAKVKSEAGSIHIAAKFKDLPAASSFGPEYLTYVLWGISPEGRASNLGEVILKKGKGRIEVTESLQTFGLVVTAEPYFAVSRPSDVVIMENVIGKDAKGQVEAIDAHYELLKRGQYTVNVTPGAPMVMDDKTPFDLYQARNAVAIAKVAGAKTYAEESLGKAEGYLEQAEAVGGKKKERIMMAREAVQRAEDARLIAVQRQETERVAMEAKWNQARVAAAQRAAEQAAANEANANKQVQTANQQTQTAEVENANLRTRLMAQLNSVLETRATARGLIVNMSGMLFQSGKATLEPSAREKLAKIAGILSTHKGLRIEAEGFTDSTGGDALNQHLSEQRADASRAYLVSQGVASEAISSKGFGKANPIASNETSTGRQANRRVELVVSGTGVTADHASR
jgi:outer membrane protein OmpA-like peptidoglycan-associated protein